MTRRRIEVNDVVVVVQPIFTIGPNDMVGALGVVYEQDARWRAGAKTQIELQHPREDVPIVIWYESKKLESLGAL